MSTTSAQSDAIFVDREADLLLLLESITGLPVRPPSIYIKSEEIDVGRRGSISILSLHIAPTQKTYLVDIYRLGSATFSIANKCGASLKNILESPAIPKVVFDIRNDSAALFDLFQISVGGIKDLQLMELASRTGSREFVSGLAKCVAEDSPISPASKTNWRLARELGHRLLLTEEDGRYKTLGERPLRPEIIEYCKQSVTLLPGLYNVYETKLRKPGVTFWRVHVRHTTKKRIELSQSPDYDRTSSRSDLGWNDQALEEEIESWNDEILTEALLGEYVLDENDEWVLAPTIDLDSLFDDSYDEDSDYDDSWDRDTARDCIGWEEDMIQNGEYF